MSQDRFETMMLVFIEQELTSKLDPDDIIKDFKHLINTRRRLKLQLYYHKYQQPDTFNIYVCYNFFTSIFLLISDL